MQNNIVIVTDPASRTLFSCHTDTVHRDSGTQQLLLDENQNILWKNDGTPLGADDGAGMWLLLNMIDAGVPGTYIFHRGEERGGIGSKAMANNEPEFLGKFDRAVAFDRKKHGHIITHQGGERCCSTEFAAALAAAFNAVFPTSPAPFAGNNTGSYTDTKEYVSLIPECTNISCGYENEHTKDEQLDVTYLEGLLAACLKIDWEMLPIKRDVNDNFSPSFWGITLTDLEHMTLDEICEFVEEDPYSAAELLFDLTRTALSFTRSTEHHEHLYKLN
jgi:hypothetical protein